jgi:fumarate reductase flavoprotein subunit
MKKYRAVLVCLMIILFVLLTAGISQAKNLEADVVVVGAGSSGLCAALTLGFGGASVVVFEKMPFPGGASNFAEGIFAVESKMQLRHKIPLTKDEAFKRHMDGTHWIANARLVRAVIDKSASTIDWLEQLGVEFIEPAAVFPGGPRTWHLVKGMGAGLVKPLVARAKAEKEIKLLLETPVKSLVMEEGRVAGVVAVDKNGNSIRAKAKVVIIASGGYGNNKDWLDKYVKGGRYATPLIPLGQTGGPIEMAWEAGAAPDGLGVVMALPIVPREKMDSHLVAAGAQPWLWINQLGERFCDESIFFNFPNAANALANQPNGVGYCVFGEDTKKFMMERGIYVGLGAFVPVLTKLIHIDRDIERGVKVGNAFIGNSLEELSEKLGVNSKVFKATVDEYNRCCEMKHDYIFAKNPKYLQMVKKGKFYAVKFSLQLLTTMGGIKINHKTEVLKKDYQVIPGLYAVGNCAGGMYGDSYELITTGGAFGFAVNSGRIAGENALKYIGK